MRNVGAEWTDGSRIRMEGDGAGKLLRFVAAAAGETAGFVRDAAVAVAVSVAEFALVAGGVVAVVTVMPAVQALSAPADALPDRVPVPTPAPRARQAPADALAGRIPVPAPAALARSAPSADIVRLAARLTEVVSGDPKAGADFLAAVEAAEGCGALACRVETRGVRFDMTEGVHVVGIDPDTGETAAIDGPGMIARQADGKTVVDEDMVAALEDGELPAPARVRTSSR